jgi:molybdenum-dependent DNA-binding transcriptional regulator ModE
MDLNATRMFVGVVQAGSLSAAATRLGLPLPTLSRRIRELERQVNVQLLERSAQGVRLTDAGSRLYEHASRGIDALLEGKQAVIADQARLKGRLRQSLPQTVEPWWELLAAFQRRYPDIQVYVYSTERRVDLIEDWHRCRPSRWRHRGRGHGGATYFVLSQYSRGQPKVGGAVGPAGRARRAPSLSLCGMGVAHRCPEAWAFIFGGCAPCSTCANWKRRMSSPVAVSGERPRKLAKVSICRIYSRCILSLNVRMVMSAIMRRRRSLIGLSLIKGSCPEIGVWNPPILRTGPASS